MLKAFFYKRKQRWESLCKGCGLCCHEKEISRAVVYLDLDSPCLYLNKSTNRCRVYQNRFAICRECRKMTLLHALFSRHLPPTCGYVQHYKKWRPFKSKVRYMGGGAP
ncbi:MAG: hypothetical protein KAU17_09170 [Spirochaetales bacterium]|nr:hypothetical protein [Spirochaetales bacterium]